MSGNLSLARFSSPLKGITKVRPDSTLVKVWVLNSTRTVLSIEWETRSAGLGVLEIELQDKRIVCNNQQKSRDFVGKVLLKVIDGRPLSAWPDLLRVYGGVDGLLGAMSPREPW